MLGSHEMLSAAQQQLLQRARKPHWSLAWCWGRILGPLTPSSTWKPPARHQAEVSRALVPQVGWLV